MKAGHLDDNEFFHWIIVGNILSISLETDIANITLDIELEYERVDYFVAALQEWAQ